MKKWGKQLVALLSALLVAFNLFTSTSAIVYAEDTGKNENAITNPSEVVEKVDSEQKENTATVDKDGNEGNVMVKKQTVVQSTEQQKVDENVKPLAKDGKVYVKIRYKQPEGDYDGWNFWIWEKGKDGRQVDFIGEDEQGKFAVVETTPEAEELGFILRKSVQGNDWKDNFFGQDKFVDVTNGDVELVIDHTSKTIETQQLNRNFAEVTVNMHYYRFDQNYGGWNLWSWIEGVSSQASQLDQEDSYGKIAKATYKNVENTDEIGVIIRKSEPGNDWVEKDTDKDRFVNLAYANNNGEIHVYLVQSDEGIYYAEKDVVRDPAIIWAKMDTPTNIRFNLNVKLSADKKVILKEGDREIASTVTMKEDGFNGIITSSEKLDLNKVYTVEIEGYKSVIVTLGQIFNSEEFKAVYHYDGELGAIYSKEKTKFVLWAPMAQDVQLALYDKGDGGTATKVPMTKGEKGTWTVEQTGDLHGKYYVYLVNNTGKYEEVTDPYAQAVGVNGNRAMVVDLDSTDPEGWSEDKKPEMKNATEHIIYEMHIRDFSIDQSSGVKMEYQGKYKGVTQEGTTLPDAPDVATGIDHLKELGVTTVHILPTFDHRSIDETKLDQPQYNWGYDPQNYNVPEGSYSSDPYNGEIRIAEFKEMVMNLHKAGIRVVMDVVYNHTGATADSHLNLAVPDYYYRQNADGGFSNGSACGNEVASERSMVRKMMIDSIVYWAEEYHIDGFRFDLMGLHDIETMMQIRTALNKVDKTILMYGEGWDAGGSALDSDLAALKVNTVKYGDMQIAAFSDDARDGIKGHVFQDKRPGFVNGEQGLEELVKFGVVASTKHDEVNYGSTTTPDYSGYGTTAWANQPYQTVNYVSAHDNLTLFDKLQTTNPDATKEELVTMNKLAAGIVLTSQGIPFLHAGDEIARTKVNEDGSFNHNSYNAPDSVNKFDWNRKVEYSDLFNYYKGLIALRKDHKAFTMNSTADIQSNLDFLGKGESFDASNVVAFTLNGKAVGDKWENIAVVFNANEEEVEVTLPSNDWVVVVDDETAGTKKLAEVAGNKATVPAQSTYVLVDKASFDSGNDTDTEQPDDGDNGEQPEQPGDNNNGSDTQKPLNPDADGNQSAQPDKDKNPNTGDPTSIAGLLALLILAAGSIFYLYKRQQA